MGVQFEPSRVSQSQRLNEAMDEGADEQASKQPFHLVEIKMRLMTKVLVINYELPPPPPPRRGDNDNSDGSDDADDIWTVWGT